MDANRNSPGYELRSELARFCLPSARREPDRNLAWVNSICILFLLIGLAGAKTAPVSLKTPPPLEEIVPTIIEPPAPPPAPVAPQKPEEQEQPKAEAPQGVVVTPESPAINFSVPTIGSLVVPNAVAAAPPLVPMQPVKPTPPATPTSHQPVTIGNSGAGGERPAPPYPEILQRHGEEGAVELLLEVSEAGRITTIEVTQSSGFPALDRTAMEFIRSHWLIPPEDGNRRFVTTVRYRLRP